MHNSSNPSKNYFQHAVNKNEVLTAVPSKKYRNGVKMSNIFKNVLESRDSCKTSITLQKRTRGSIVAYTRAGDLNTTKKNNDEII